MKIRLNKYMALSGIASRREADSMISEGRVCVNGVTVEALGTQIDGEKDTVEVDGKLAKRIKTKLYLMLNKPPGYLVTVKDPFQRPTVMDLIPELKDRVFPVGRLDFNSEGLVMLTNDGNLAYRLTHPKFQVIKEYRLRVRPKPDQSILTTLEKGIFLDGKKTAPAKFRVITTTTRGTLLLAKLHEGRKRELRRMFESMGFQVLALKRVTLGSLNLGQLKEGHWRYLTREEITRLKKKVQLL
jgi:pseudouridine synthase